MMQAIVEGLAYLVSEPNLLYSVLFILGICVGSFMNVCIYRLPDESKSVLFPPSSCPGCSKRIAWYDNIPLLSYLILQAKCRYCRMHIPSGYFWVELFCGFLFVGFIWWFGVSVKTFFHLFLCCMLLVGSIIDWKLKIIPDEITFYGMLAGLGVSYFFPQVQGEIDARLAIADSIIGLLAGGGIIYLIAVLGDIIFRRESMGGGDIKLLAMIGAFLGWQAAIFVFLLSPYFAIISALYSKFYKKEATIPYGPFLSLATVAVIFFGDMILNFIGIR